MPLPKFGIEVEGGEDGVLTVRSVNHNGFHTYLSQCAACPVAVVGDSIEGVSIWFGLHIMAPEHGDAAIPIPVKLPKTWVTQSWFELSTESE